MKVEIDQSGKIEDTSKPTVIAFANEISRAILIPAKVKRQIQEVFRRQGKPRLFVYRTFAAGIFLLIKDYLPKIKIQNIIVDTEYTGHEKQTKEIIIELIRRYNLPEPNIYFQRIGDEPKVHYAAYDVFSKKEKADKVASFEEIVALATKKTEVT
jgi:hypothetical protein